MHPGRGTDERLYDSGQHGDARAPLVGEGAVRERRSPEPELIDDLERGHRRRHTIIWVGALSAGLLVSMVMAVGLGPVRVGPATVARIGHHTIGQPGTVTWTGAEDSIVWLVRAPRVLLGAVVGAGLAIAGVALQAMIRNVLADPYILGVTSGASVGAAATILFGVGAAVGASSLTASAFLGAMLATGVLFLLARVGGRVTSIRMLLAGVAIGYVLSAGVPQFGGGLGMRLREGAGQGVGRLVTGRIL